RRLCQGNRPGQAEGHRRAGPAARAGVSDLRAARPVHGTDGDPRQPRRPLAHAVAGALERREEVVGRHMVGSDTAFAGSIPALYDRHLGPLLFEPYAEDAAARLPALKSGALLEVPAGTGIVTQALAWRLPAAVDIVATDLN